MRSIRARSLTFSLCCCIACGCAVHGESTLKTQPTSPMPVQPGKTPVVTVQQLGEALARRIEATDPAKKLTSQHVYKLAKLAADRAGVTVDLGPVPDNAELSAADRAAWVAQFRGWR